MSEELNPQQAASRFDKMYRLVLINDESYEEVGSYRVTELNVYLLLSSLLVAVVLLVMLLFVFTPLKNIIPGFADVDALSNRKEIVKLYKHVDSLDDVLDAQRVYIQSIGKAMRGEIGATDLKPPAEIDGFAAANAHLAQAVADPKKNTTAAPDEAVAAAPEKLNLQSPLAAGLVTDAFNAQPDHFGIDIAAAKNTPVQAVADGVVICATWTLDTGFVIGIQHKNNLVSFYKHNSFLYKQVGTTVKAGEAIAVIGNTGHLSSGPHLHFELWQNGKPINPSSVITF
jgi:murein DD-endopeptidase MepM/ murein hydrolase activator NlpD